MPSRSCREDAPKNTRVQRSRLIFASNNNDSRIETAGRKFTLPERPNTGGGQGLSYVDAEESVNLISS